MRYWLWAVCALARHCPPICCLFSLLFSFQTHKFNEILIHDVCAIYQLTPSNCRSCFVVKTMAQLYNNTTISLVDTFLCWKCWLIRPLWYDASFVASTPMIIHFKWQCTRNDGLHETHSVRSFLLACIFCCHFVVSTFCSPKFMFHGSVTYRLLSYYHHEPQSRSQ